MMKKFINFLVIWISQNLAMPFWIVGHIHLSHNVFRFERDISPVGMNLIVLAGFIMDYRNSIKGDRTTNTKEKDTRT